MSYILGNESSFTKRIHFMLDYFGEQPGKGDLLDLGCGVGTFALIFAQRGLNTIGLDISEESIRTCRDNAVNMGVEDKAQFVCGSSTEDHFGARRFDYIIAADIIEHLPPSVLEKTLTNCYYWLRPEGKLVIHTFPTKYYYLLANSKLALLLIPALISPAKLAEIYVLFLDRVVVQSVYRVHFGQTYSCIIAGSAHCNPPHPFQFRNLLSSVGFEVTDYRLLEEPLSGLSGDQPRYPFGIRLIRRHQILRPAIAAIAQRPN